MSSASPLVSVIIPAFNAEFFIRQTLNSVLRQTYRNLEVWVVDDGSQDKTPAIVESYSAIDSRVKLLQQLNQGVAAARNLAIRHSSGEFVAPIDADDIWFKSKIERQVLRFQQASEQTGLVYAWSAAISERGRLLGGCANWEVEGRALTPLIYRNFIGNASVPLIRRKCIDHVGGYDPALRQRGAQGCEDWDITLRIAEHYDFAVVPEFLVGYRQLDGSMSGNVDAMARSFSEIMAPIRARHPEIPGRVFRWSEGYFYLYLTGKSYLSGNMSGALKWLAHSMRSDASLLFAPVAYRLCLVSLLRMIASPITSLIWPDQQAWIEWKQRLRRSKRARGKTIRSLMQAAYKPHLVWKPYDLIQHWRDAQISACWQTGA